MVVRVERIDAPPVYMNYTDLRRWVRLNPGEMQQAIPVVAIEELNKLAEELYDRRRSDPGDREV